MIGDSVDPTEPCDKNGSKVSDRAGTNLDHKNLIKVNATRVKTGLAGLIDRTNRLYQFGGDLNRAVYWKYDAFTYEVEEMDDMQRYGARRIEFVYKEKNVCYAISMEKALRLRFRVPSQGDRWFIPFKAWDKYDACGNLLLPAKIEPSNLPLAEVGDKA